MYIETSAKSNFERRQVFYIQRARKNGSRAFANGENAVNAG